MLNAKCTLTSTQLYIKWKDVHTHICTHLNTRRNTHLFYSALPFLSSCFCSSVFSLVFVLIYCAHFSSTLNPLLFYINSIICPFVCHALLLILQFFLFIVCFFYFFVSTSSLFFLVSRTSIWLLSRLPNLLPPLSCSLFLFISPPHFICLSTDCQFEISGWDGIIHSSQVEEEERVKPGDALDCIWTIRAPPQSKVSTRDHISHLKW